MSDREFGFKLLEGQSKIWVCVCVCVSPTHKVKNNDPDFVFLNIGFSSTESDYGLSLEVLFFLIL